MELHSIEAIVKALNEAGVRYLVVGGFAVNAHGFERFTHDLDIVIQLEPENVVTGLRTLIGIGYQLSIPISPEMFADTANRKRWREEKGMLVLKLWSDLHRRTPIDVFVYEPFDFDVEYQRATSFAMDGEVAVPVIARPALLAMKREAGREKDLLDISALGKLEDYR